MSWSPIQPLYRGGGGGDFNLYFDKALETDGGNPKLKIKLLFKLLAMMQENDLCDIYRIRNQDEKRFTWRCRNPFLQRRLDYFFISDFLQDLVETADILPSVQSDHSTLKLKFSPINEQSRGPSSYKFNNSLTTDKCFVDSMKSSIPTFYEESRELKDPVMRWEFLKYKIRQFTINCSKEKVSERKARRISLEKTVKTLEISLSTNSNEKLLEEYYKYKNELESIYNFIAEGIVLRSKASWYEHGEKSSKYFLNLEKRNKAKSHLRKIINSDGHEVCNETEIRQKLKQFYSSLYKRRSNKTVELMHVLPSKY